MLTYTMHLTVKPTNAEFPDYDVEATISDTDLNLPRLQFIEKFLVPMGAALQVHHQFTISASKEKK